MNPAIRSLETCLKIALARLATPPFLASFEFKQLKIANDALGVAIECAPKKPQKERCQEAILLLKKDPKQLSKQDWKVVVWGLSDSDLPNQSNCVLDDKQTYRAVCEYVANQIKQQTLKRSLWFGLVFSYFSYPRPMIEVLSPLSLLIQGGLDLLVNQQKNKNRNQPLWMQVTQKNLELFDPKNAGTTLAQALLNNESNELDQVNNHLHIPVHSWLYERIIQAQLKQLTQLEDFVFYQKIDLMLSLMSKYPKQRDQILSASLSRYEQSAQRNSSHAALKKASLETWGSPQIKSKQGLWRQHVNDVILKMVQRWFAKDDLEHFFRLLEGRGGVDQRRLDYWLHFVDQMSFTKIVLGRSAKDNPLPDFVDFRNRNKGRIGFLSGSTALNNAFIIQIDDYLFVEFSEIGALFVYRSHNSPFDINAIEIHEKELKNRELAIKRITHQKSLWEDQFTQVLSQLGIYPSRFEQPDPPSNSRAPQSTAFTEKTPTIDNVELPNQSNARPERERKIDNDIVEALLTNPIYSSLERENIRMSNQSNARLEREKKMDKAMDNALSLARQFPSISVQDDRQTSGVYRLISSYKFKEFSKYDFDHLLKELEQCGFKYDQNQQEFWIR